MPTSLLVWLLIGLHCGVEPYPLSWQKHPVLGWLNFATMHNRHHLELNKNFGLYYSFWDRVMKTGAAS